jgi:hypothetical protein
MGKRRLSLSQVQTSRYMLDFVNIGQLIEPNILACLALNAVTSSTAPSQQYTRDSDYALNKS